MKTRHDYLRIFTLISLVAVAAFAVWTAVTAPVPNYLLAAGSTAILLPVLFITIVKQSGRQARDTENKFHNLLQASPEAIIITNRKGAIVLLNGQAEKLFGYTLEELRGQSVENLFTKAARPVKSESYLALCSISQAGQVDSNPALFGRRKDGTEINLEMSSSPLQTGDDLLILHMIRNITERLARDRQRAVRQAAQRILAETSTLRDAAPGLLQVLCDGLHWDLAFLWMVNRQTGGLDRVGISQAGAAKALGHERPIREHTLAPGAGWPGRVLSAGQPVWLADISQEGANEALPVSPHQGVHAVLGFPITLGSEVVGVIELFARRSRPREADVLETLQSVANKIGQFVQRKLAEEAVYRSEARKAAVLEAALDAIITIDHEGRILEFNPAAEQMFGRPCTEVQGREMAELLLPAYWAAEFRQGLARCEVAGNGTALAGRCELTARRADGTPFPVELTTTRIRTDGAPMFTCYIRDLSERKQAEESLRQSEERYRQSQKMEAVGRLAGGIAHDFNNILTVITGCADLLLLHMAKDDSQRGFVETIVKSSDRAASLVRQMLAFSRKQVQALKVLDLNTLVSDLGSMLQRVIGEDVDLSTVLAPDVQAVRADPGQLEQVLMNLVVNARDAMPDGGKLTLETSNVELDESYTREYPGVRPGRYVMLAVSDTGCGMSKEVQARLFEPFFTTKEVGKGTGLGLATVYGIVKQSEGHITAYSEMGRGSTFKVYLPAVAEAATVLQVSHPIPAPLPAGSGTVLLVEDEEEVRRLSRHVLQRNGYEVLEARHATEALEIYERQGQAVDLMVTDVVMPEMNGCDLANRLQSHRRDLKVLFMSGYTDTAVLRHGLLAEGTAFLQKPFTPNALASKVREMMVA
jgi:PAS domain S-box-containing protein